MFDVAIIGAGPAGTAAAFDLLKFGFKVLILDKYEFPRKKACAGGLTPKCFNAFRYDISSLVKRECYTVRINSACTKSFHIKNNTPLCYLTDRKELDLFSLNKVINQGAVFKVIKPIKQITERPNFVEIQTRFETFKAKYLIGADGANSQVRRLFVKKQFFQKQTALEADVKVDHVDRYPMEFDFSQNKNGYYWLFPKDDHVNIGIYSTDPSVKLNIKLLTQYAEDRLGSNKLVAFKGYPICTNGFSYKIDSNRVLLAGDAAGMSERLLGEGIYFAIKTGQLAALAIVTAEQTQKSVIDIYLPSLKKIQNDLKLYDWGAKCLYHFPMISLKALSIPFFHRPFVKGYADGKPLTDIVSTFLSKNSSK